MALSVSLSVFAGLHGGTECDTGKRNARLLFRLKDANNGQEWICSYRIQTAKGSGLASAHTVPNYLEYCGVLLVGDCTEALLRDVLPAQLLNQGLHVFKWDYKPEDGLSLQESVKYLQVTPRNGEFDVKEAPLSNVTWVDDDMAEIARRGYTPIATTLMANLPLQNCEELELSADLLGLKRVEHMPAPLKSAVSGFLGDQLANYLSVENEGLTMDFTDVPVPKTTAGDVDAGYAHLAFGGPNGYRKHVLIYSVPPEREAEDAYVELELVLQTTCIVPSENVGDEPTEELAEASLQALRHVANLTFSSDAGRKSTEVCITPAGKRVRTDDEAAEKPASKGKGPSKGSKGKSASNRTRKPEASKHTKAKETTVLELLKDVGPFEVAVGKSTREVFLTATLDKTSGKITVSAGQAKPAPPQPDFEKAKVHVIAKAFVPGADKSNPVFPFGGATVNVLKLLRSTGDDVAECVTNTHVGTHLKLLLNVTSMCDQGVLFSPHQDGAVFPPWMSNKTARASLVRGHYQYYHYMQGGKNDSGWGCCYRSIQMVASWYLMQYATVKPVPAHDEIQRHLREKDPSHAGMVVGGSTWIGTVEAGYFINWYLQYGAKTFYLSDANEFRNYNGVIANHFATVGSPIIMGAGMYAYVIVGICIGAQAGKRWTPIVGDVAYLIADPHYVGEDSVKQIKAKGAVAWKKIDFISKAANGSFINLCCPQLDVYED
ncbi:peptidase family c78 protein [Babesia caballi]|uniref:Peptidase family c78 protein n=1 Tax=Babesia caballi TaxID=5871 RepID=A0AAV4LMV9_BABCB|nr:peptidase family c78 protein [Babesia caballi]